jgi:hypothetical protein
MFLWYIWKMSIIFLNNSLEAFSYTEPAKPCSDPYKFVSFYVFRATNVLL